MKLRELLESGIIIGGYRRVQCWETEDCPTIYFEGADSGEVELEKYMEREVAYIFPITNGDNMPCLVIELAERNLPFKGGNIMGSVILTGIIFLFLAWLLEGK